MKTAYIFINSFYIFFDYLDEDYIKVQLKAKNIITKSKLESSAGEFLNQLLHHRIRFDIQNETKNLRQLILGRALYTECIETDSICDSVPNQNCTSSTDDTCIDIEEDYNTDCYNIGRNWEQDMRCSNDG